MITEQTAEAIVIHNRELGKAEYCLKNIEDSAAKLEVIVMREFCDECADTTNEFNIGPECFGRILRDIIARQRARLDELNALAVQEAQDA
jgi:hypothetical protein